MVIYVGDRINKLLTSREELCRAFEAGSHVFGIPPDTTLSKARTVSHHAPAPTGGNLPHMGQMVKSRLARCHKLLERMPWNVLARVDTTSVDQFSSFLYIMLVCLNCECKFYVRTKISKQKCQAFPCHFENTCHSRLKFVRNEIP